METEMKPTDETVAAAGPTDYCYDAIRACHQKHRVFRKRFKRLRDGKHVARKRMLREFIPILQEIEREAATTIKAIEELATNWKAIDGS
jgi:hypothetical protein